MRRPGWLVLLLFVGTIAYYLPWFDHPTAGWTLHAYDLAEWASLHPAVRGSSPPLLTSFLLRLPQVMLAVGLALAAGGLRDARLRALVWALAAILALRFLPPSEFFSSARADPNYRQMLLLTGLGLVGAATGALLGVRAGRWSRALVVLALVVGVAAGWWGLSRAGTLMDNFEIDVRVGMGPVLLTLASATVAALALIPARPVVALPGGDNKKGG